MCKVYNEVGCISTIKQQLHRQGIWEFNTLHEIVEFAKKYQDKRNQIIYENQIRLEEEKSNLQNEIIELDHQIESAKKAFEENLRDSLAVINEEIQKLQNWNKRYFFQHIYSDYRQLYLRYRSKQILSRLISETPDQVKFNLTLRDVKAERLQYIRSNFAIAVAENGSRELRELDRRYHAIEQLKTFIYGAYGEQDVVNRLQTLPDDSILINDFSASFFKALYYQNENSYIKTIQADHVLVTPAGIFIIETKNWSEKSINDQNLFSPIQQIKRTSFAIFKIINEGIVLGRLKVGQHHWGHRKLPLRNIIVLSKAKPAGEFQYVKVLLASELVGYISYFKPVFSNQEISEIAHYLMNYSTRNI